MKTNEEVIKLTNKEIARYEIFIEVYDRNKHMRFPIKRSALIEDEFKTAIDMCNNENKKDIFTHIYKAVKVIDRAKAKIVMEEILC